MRVCVVWCVRLYGSYGALRAGSTARALQDLSGGIVQAFSLRQPRALTFRVLNSAVPRSTLLLAALAAREPRRGLLPRQPYVVTGLARVRSPAAGDRSRPNTTRIRLTLVNETFICSLMMQHRRRRGGGRGRRAGARARRVGARAVPGRVVPAQRGVARAARARPAPAAAARPGAGGLLVSVRLRRPVT